MIGGVNCGISSWFLDRNLYSNFGFCFNDVYKKYDGRRIGGSEKMDFTIIAIISIYFIGCFYWGIC